MSGLVERNRKVVMRAPLQACQPGANDRYALAAFAITRDGPDMRPYSDTVRLQAA